MQIKCDYCGEQFNKKPSKIGATNYCNIDCLKAAHRIYCFCTTCSTPIVKTPATMYANPMCSRKCLNAWNSQRFTDSNPEWNKDKMTMEVRRKLRNARLGKGEGKTYTKLYGEHLHRVIAKMLLGRDLLPNEVVHHIDEDKRNNNPSNLIIFPSQAAHTAHHNRLRHAKRRGFSTMALPGKSYRTYN